MTRFARWACDGGFTDYEDLWAWSVEDLPRFWRLVWEYFDVQADAVPERVLGSARMPGAEWFPGVRLNYAEHIFRGREPSDPAIFFASEASSPVQSWDWARLRAETARVRQGLIERGVCVGDRVVAYLGNVPETVAALLATASLGAVWSSCSPDFGAQSVIDRFAQIEPKVLLATDTYDYGGKTYDKSPVVDRLRAELGADHVVLLSEWFPETDAALDFDRVPFDHPLWVLYSSGTTGLPKAIVQGQGGILLEHLKKMHLHLNAQAGDRVFWFTTTGWMMWNFLVGVLLTPASIVLYDGNPGHPDMGRLWDLAEETGMTVFGTGAAYIHGCMKAGVKPAEGRSLSLRSVGSTGSPLSPEGFEWVYSELGPVWLFSTSGGTDVCTAFVGGVPWKPVWEGELQGRALGCDVRAFDESGESVVDEVGELVITQPMPSMPLFLWGDDDGSRLHESYFDTFEGVWRHGDWIRLTDRGTAVISGRSDSTINRGGIRMGTAEIYSAALSVDAVTDALVVDVDDWMPLFVVTDGEPDLDAIKRAIREHCSPRHVPSEVIRVDAVPRTLSGKVLEVPVKKLLQGADPEKVASRESLANPEAFDWFVEFSAERLSER